jgi:hypothetical protein
MDIRRRHTKNFTTIGNALFNDERLAADEVGIMGYLLSRPHDWETRRPALMRRWHLGRDAMRRVLTNLVRTGWLQAEKIRLSNGTFKVTYEIQDEPGPSLSEDEVKAAFSVVSAEAGDDNSSENDTPEHPPPDTPKPYVDGRIADTRGWEESLNTDSLNTESTKAAVPNWSDLRQKWPASEILSPLACEKLFASLSQEDRRLAVDGVRAYLARCKERNRKTCDLSTYLKERRFETVKVEAENTMFTLRPGTPQAARWLEDGALTDFQRYRLQHGQAITVQTEWPPTLPKEQSTGPPLSPLMTKEDEEELKKWG